MRLWPVLDRATLPTADRSALASAGHNKEGRPAPSGVPSLPISRETLVRSLRLRCFRSGGAGAASAGAAGAASAGAAGAASAGAAGAASAGAAGAASAGAAGAASAGAASAGAASAGAASAGAASAGADGVMSVDGDGAAPAARLATSHHKETNGQNHQQQTQTLHRITLSQRNRSFRDACATQPRDTHFSPAYRSIHNRFYSRAPEKSSQPRPPSNSCPKWGIIG